MLEDARQAGLLGPGPVARHLDHALGFAAAVPAPPAHGLDLGSGAGVPGLPLADHWPHSQWVLLESSAQRARFLERAVLELALDDRVTVVHARAEDAGHDRTLRAAHELVVARGFGTPAVVAECAAPFLREEGWLVVSEPPASDGARWRQPALDELGLAWDGLSDRHGTFARLVQKVRCPARFPRRAGVPARRPLF